MPTTPVPPGGRFELTITIAVASLTTVAMLTAFVLIPEGRLDPGPFAWFIVGIVAIVLSLIQQVRAVLRAKRPGLRAVIALGLIVPIIVVAFAAVYLALAGNDPRAFNEHLTRVDAVYFTITVLSTVGFGDIHAVSEAARIAVGAQMLIDLVLVTAIARLLLNAVGRARETSAGQSEAAAHDRS